MSYYVAFKGSFEYESQDQVIDALNIIDFEEDNPDEDEPNFLRKEDFIIHEKSLSIEFDNMLSPRYWYGGIRVLYRMSKKAIKGSIKCYYDDKRKVNTLIKAGTGYD